MLRLFRHPSQATPACPTDTIGGFGKLALHTEFIRHQVRSREAVALDRWVSEGVNFMMRRHGADWSDQMARSAGFRFVWTGSDSDRTVTGVLAPSQDRSGRPYPFVIFTTTAATVFQAMPSAVAGIYATFYARADAILAEQWNGQPLSVLARMLDDLTVPDTAVSKQAVVDHEISALESTPMARLWHACGPEFGMEHRQAFLGTLQAVLQTVRRRAPGRIPWGIRLPLPAEGGCAPTVLFWVHLIQTLVGDAAMRPHYMWSRIGIAGPRRLTFFFRPLPPSYLLSLINTSVRDGAVYDILTEMQNPPESSVWATPAVTDDRLSLMGFLDAVGPGRRTS